MTAVDERSQPRTAQVDAFAALKRLVTMDSTAQHESLTVLGSAMKEFRVAVVREAGEHPPGTPEEALLAAWPGTYQRALGEGEQAQASSQPTQHHLSYPPCATIVMSWQLHNMCMVIETSPCRADAQHSLAQAHTQIRLKLQCYQSL